LVETTGRCSCRVYRLVGGWEPAHLVTHSCFFFAVGRAEPSRTAGNQDGENKPGSRTAPGVAASLSCVALVVVAVFALTFWKKRRSDPPPDKVPSDLI
ncbi:hypothetical protein XENOCAPTIV_028906, partial [Xenoophorus captivus]